MSEQISTERTTVELEQGANTATNKQEAEVLAYAVKPSMNQYIDSKAKRKDALGKLANLNAMTKEEIELWNMQSGSNGGHKWARDQYQGEVSAQREAANTALAEADSILAEPNETR